MQESDARSICGDTTNWKSMDLQGIEEYQDDCIIANLYIVL